MKYIHFMLGLVVVLALAGAPFGMGRMMAFAHDSHASLHHTRISHDKVPADGSLKPHYMACAACTAVLPAIDFAEIAAQRPEIGIVILANLFEGRSLLPDERPPRL